MPIMKEFPGFLIENVSKSPPKVQFEFLVNVFPFSASANTFIGSFRRFITCENISFLLVKM